MAKLTPEQVEERKALIAESDKKRREKFNDPDRIKKRERLKEAFNGDVDLIADMLISAWDDSAAVQKENEGLVKELNRIHAIASGLSSKTVEPHVKFNVAHYSAQWDPTDPVARAFLSALDTGKSLTAIRNAHKAHALGNAAKAFVQAEWQAHRSAYSENKSDFARAYARRVLNEFGFRIGEKQMREVWLKDEAPPAKQAR